MLSSTVRDSHGEPIANQAYAYIYDPDKGYTRVGDDIDAVGSHGLFSSADDMGRWLVNLDTGKVGGPTVLKKMFEAAPLSSGEWGEYARGWKVDTYKGVRRYSASGIWGGYNSTIQYFPEHRFGGVILCNWVSGWVHPVYAAMGVANIYLADHWVQKGAPATVSKTAPPSKETAMDPKTLEDFTGVYRWEPGFTVEVTSDGNRLYLILPGDKMSIERVAENEFVLNPPGYGFAFGRDESGVVDRVRIRHDSMKDIVAPQIELWKPTRAELKRFAGRYYCKELDAVYTIVLKDEKLVLVHRRRGELNLTPEARNIFVTGSSDFPMLEFHVRGRKRVAGFELDGLPLEFKKQ